MKQIHLASCHVVGWWVVVCCLVGGDPSKWHRLTKNRHLVGFVVGVFWLGMHRLEWEGGVKF